MAIHTYILVVRLNLGLNLVGIASFVFFVFFRIACIKQLLGMLQESLVDYSSVLEKEPDFVPALKGTYLPTY